MIWFTAANLALAITQFSKVSLTCYMNIKFSIDDEASSKKFLLIFADKITESLSEVRFKVGIGQHHDYNDNDAQLSKHEFEGIMQNAKEPKKSVDRDS